jgi:hypothetical protein
VAKHGPGRRCFLIEFRYIAPSQVECNRGISVLMPSATPRARRRPRS